MDAIIRALGDDQIDDQLALVEFIVMRFMSERLALGSKSGSEHGRNQGES